MSNFVVLVRKKEEPIEDLFGEQTLTSSPKLKLQFMECLNRNQNCCWFIVTPLWLAPCRGRGACRPVAWGFRRGRGGFSSTIQKISPAAIFLKNFTKFGKFWGGGLPLAGYGPGLCVSLILPAMSAVAREFRLYMDFDILTGP